MRQTLDETLQDLHRQLQEVKDFDAEHVALLRATVAEIEDTLDKNEISSASIAERLRAATEQFSGSHPVLVGTVGRVADLLSQMGI